MENPKILVGAPIHEVKAYCYKDYCDILKKLTYKNYDILLADNSPTDNFMNLIKKEGIPVIKGPYFEGAMDRIVASRNLIVEHLLNNDYDYFFSLEADVIPPIDAIERLLAHKKEIVSGLYFNFQILREGRKPAPMAWFNPTNNEKEMYYLPDEISLGPQKLIKLFACGLGCVLIHKNVLKNIRFRHKYPEHSGFDDVWFCKDAREQGYEIYLDNSIKCEHITIPGGKWIGLKK
ncbi:MAG: hypothetical protein HYS32_02575 [Candidatus Woesearchaeota archaeon]|nr:MAG: hypothetical protein HYS32_02575 [Candidatus Woesearchaeota archaeon]